MVTEQKPYSFTQAYYIQNISEDVDKTRKRKTSY
jgi:hypothetical protein